MTNGSINSGKVARGLLAADVTAAVLSAAFSFLTDHSGLQSLAYLGLLLVAGMVYSLIIIIVFALPLICILSRFRLINLVTAVLAGTAIGATIAALMERPHEGLIAVALLNFGDYAVMRIWAFSAIGCAAAVIFWLITREGSIRMESD